MRGLCVFAKSAKFLNLAFKIDKLKTKYKNSTLCLSEKLASFYTLLFIHKTVVKHLKKLRNIKEILIKLTLILVCQITFGQSEINGFVKSSITDLRPITDVYIEITNIKKPVLERMEMADSLGFFKFVDLEPNKVYKLKVSAFGYADKIYDVKTDNRITKTTLTLDASCEFSEKQAEVDWKNGKAKLLLVGSIASIANSPADNKFEKKYGIEYYDFGCTPPIYECVKIYNQQMFELMDKKYGKSWRKNVRTDVEFLNFQTNSNELIGEWECYHKELEDGTTKSTDAFSGKEFEYSCDGLIIKLNSDFSGTESIGGLKFKYQRNDSILNLGNRNYIIEKLTNTELIIRDYDSGGFNISNFRQKFKKKE